MKNGILIGITGASGSGKTLVAQTIYDKIGSDKVVIIQEDSYYKDLSDIPFNERTGKNFDHPDAFDHNLLEIQLKKLLNGEIIEHPIYDYKTHTRLNQTNKVGPNRIIVVEGILIMSDQRLRDLMDIKIFVETSFDLCLIRRLRRDINSRGRSLDSVLDQYLNSVRPMYFKYIEPAKNYADIIIPRGGKNLVAIDIITTKIKSLLK